VYSNAVHGAEGPIDHPHGDGGSSGWHSRAKGGGGIEAVMVTNFDNLASLFCELSSVLTGEAVVAPASAERHLKALRDTVGSGQIDAILKCFGELKDQSGDIAQAVRDGLVNDPSLGPPVRKIILLWYTGLIDVGQGPPAPGSQDDYFEALMWSAVGAHPPGLSDGYYGHWRYPPDVGV
jgi:hypothetical protein